MSTGAKKRNHAWLPASPFVSPARTIGDVAAGSLARLLGQRGLANMEIMAHWAEIVGAELAQACAPEKIVWPRAGAHEDAEHGQARRGAVLHIRVEGPQAVEIQHRSGEIISRINQLFGFSAVEKIRIIQAPLVRREHAREKPGAAAKSTNSTEPGTEPGPEPDADGSPLAAALSRLARGVKKG